MTKKKEATAKLEKLKATVTVHASASGTLLFEVTDPEVIAKLRDGAVYACEMTFSDPTTIGGDGGDKPPHP